MDIDAVKSLKVGDIIYNNEALAVKVVHVAEDACVIDDGYPREPFRYTHYRVASLFHRTKIEAIRCALKFARDELTHATNVYREWRALLEAEIAREEVEEQ